MKSSMNSDFYEAFEYKGFWLYEIVNFIHKKTKMKVSLLLFLLLICPPILLFLPELITRFQVISKFSIFTIIALLMAGAWSFIGPLCIYNYHQKLILFFQKIKSKQDISKEAVRQIENEAFRNINRNTLLLSALWSFVVLMIFMLNPESMNAYGFYGFRDPYFLLLLCYLVLLLNLTACGFYFVIVTVRMIVKFSKKNIFIQNMLEDNHISIKIFGNLSFSATLYFATGLLYFPILIDFCRMNNVNIANLTFIPVLIYLLFLLYAYIYPNYQICTKANQEKEKLLKKLQVQYTKCLKNLKEGEDVEEQLYMLNLYHSMEYIQGMNVYPTNVKNALMIFSTIILPISVFFLDKFDFVYEPFLHTLFG